MKKKCCWLCWRGMKVLGRIGFGILLVVRAQGMGMERGNGVGEGKYAEESGWFILIETPDVTGQVTWWIQLRDGEKVRVKRPVDDDVNRSVNGTVNEGGDSSQRLETKVWRTAALQWPSDAVSIGLETPGGELQEKMVNGHDTRCVWIAGKSDNRMLSSEQEEEFFWKKIEFSSVVKEEEISKTDWKRSRVFVFGLGVDMKVGGIGNQRVIPKETLTLLTLDEWKKGIQIGRAEEVSRWETFHPVIPRAGDYVLLMLPGTSINTEENKNYFLEWFAVSLE